jgi:hypothetical protein
MAAPVPQRERARVLSLEAVLAEVRPGRVVYLDLTREQRRALSDPDGQTALDVLRHLLGAREAMNAPERFPLTEETFCAVARKLGRPVGQKRARRLAARLVESSVVGNSGHYRQPYRYSEPRDGFHVRLYKLIAGVRQLPLKTQLPVGKRQRVKRRSRPRERRRWWQHPLFGMPDGRPPPGIRKDVAKKMRSLDEMPAAAARVLAATAP